MQQKVLTITDGRTDKSYSRRHCMPAQNSTHGYLDAKYI
jgi:hypothetical protein